MNYGTLENGIMKPAPKAVRIGDAMVCNPTDEQYAEAFVAINAERARDGKPPYLETVDTPPQTDEAHYVVATGWTRDGDTWRRVYDVREVPPPPPRTFSKLRIVAALTTAGVWDSVKQLLIERGLYDLFLAAQDFKSDNKYFENGKTALQTALGWTDEQVESVLAAAEGGA